MFGLQGPESYAYTSRSGCLDVPGIDDSKDFADTQVNTLTSYYIKYRVLTGNLESYAGHWLIRTGTN